MARLEDRARFAQSQIVNAYDENPIGVPTYMALLYEEPTPTPDKTVTSS